MVCHYLGQRSTLGRYNLHSLEVAYSTLGVYNSAADGGIHLPEGAILYLQMCPSIAFKVDNSTSQGTDTPELE
jgi:hypothetical protein